MRHIFYIILLLVFTPFMESWGQSTYSKIEHNSLNDEKVKNFGLAISKSIAKDQHHYFLDRINLNEFYPKIIINDQSNKKLAKFNKNFESSYQKKIRSFPQNFINEVNQGALYNFVSYYFDQYDGTYYLIFRYYSQQSGLDYHEYRLVEKQGAVVIDDIYVYSTNQKLSDTLKLYYLGHVPKNILAPLTKKPDYKYVLMLKNFVDSNNNNELKKAYKHIKLLNNSLKKEDRFVATLKLNLSSQISEEEYFESMEDILNKFPVDPSIRFLAMEYHFLNKDYGKVQQCLINIQKHTNDKFIDFEKANLAFAAKDFERAKMYYENMVKNYPNFLLPKFSLLVVYDQLNDFPTAVLLLEDILNTSSFKKKNLAQRVKDQLPKFAASSNFKAWQKNEVRND